MRISDWSSDVCSSDLVRHDRRPARIAGVAGVFGPAGVLGCAGVLGATWRLRSAGTGSSARLLRGTGVGCGGAGLLLHRAGVAWLGRSRSEEHTSELQSLMRISYAVFCLKKKKIPNTQNPTTMCNYYTTQPPTQ